MVRKSGREGLTLDDKSEFQTNVMRIDLVKDEFGRAVGGPLDPPEDVIRVGGDLRSYRPEVMFGHNASLMSALPACDPDAFTGESQKVDFKASFDPQSKQDWCELIKDIIAMTNSGGGCLIIGVNDDGSHSGALVHE